MTALVLLAAAPLRAQNPTMEPDFSRIMQWLTYQTAQGLAFNSGSTFDPPNEMHPWRFQPDFSLGLGVMPYDKGTFPRMQVQALEEKNPKADLPDDVKFPNLTFHSRMGLPWRMDAGVRLVNMTVPKNYRLSESTVGNGQSNTVGFALRKHFMGRGAPLVSVTGAYNRVSGYFNFRSRFEEVELVKGVFSASSVNSGQLDWTVTSIGLNLVVSQVYGKWTPFLGAGYNRISGVVDGRLEAVWDTTFIASTLGKASSRPEPNNTRLIFGFQRDGSFFRYFVNGEVKTSGVAAGRAFVLSTGLAAPFKIGANSTVVRYGRNKPKTYQASAQDPLFEYRRLKRESAQTARRPREGKKIRKTSGKKGIWERYRNWSKKRTVKKRKSSSAQMEKALSEAQTPPERAAAYRPARRESPPELIFIR